MSTEAPLSMVEAILVRAARRAGINATTGWGSNDPIENARRRRVSDACQVFLEAHGPEYRDTRAWKARLASVPGAA